MNGNTLWMLYVVATWLCFGSTLARPLRYTKEYPTLNFTTENATVKSYTTFITTLRNHLVTGNDVRSGIPVLPSETGLPIAQRFILVQLSSWVDEPVTLALDVTIASVVGFRVEKKSYFFKPDNPEVAEAITHLFTDTAQRKMFNFSGHYGDLENQAQEKRENIDLGIEPLEEALSSIYLYTTGYGHLSSLASSFITCIEMVSAAARYGYIEERIRQSITKSTPFRPGSRIISYENSWVTLSSAIQYSNQQVFQRPIRIQNGVVLDNVRNAVIFSGLALMKFECRSPRQSSIIKSVVPNFADDVCEVPEPTVRITGRNGLCVDVKYGFYFNGNEIQLYPCKINQDENQFWTLKRDGTIRSNGKCLTSEGYKSGDSVVIYDCPSTVTNTTSWKVWENGTITSESGLVLAAKSGASGTTLTVETNNYGASQSWLPTNNTAPIITNIVALQNYCLEANGNNVWVDKCASNKTEQKWGLYGDGTIRSQQNQDSCLTNDPNHGIIVEILSCSLGSSGQRWVFKNDSTIWNLYRGMVLDVAYSDPNIKRIVIWQSNGKANEKWSLL